MRYTLFAVNESVLESLLKIAGLAIIFWTENLKRAAVWRRCTLSYFSGRVAAASDRKQ